MRLTGEHRPEPVVRFGAKRLYRDAGSMMSSSVAHAVLGIGFWTLAAKMFPPHELGTMTAVLAVITSTGVVLASGIGDAYTALLPSVGAQRASFYRLGQRLFAGMAIVCGVVAALCTTRMLDEVRGSTAVGVLVAVGILIWSAGALQNSTLAALGRASWLPAANIAASIGKIALLPLLAINLHWHSVELAVLIATAIVFLVLRPAIGRLVVDGDDLSSLSAPEELKAGTFVKFVAQTSISSALSMGLLMVTPFLVAVYANTSQGALFSLSLSIVQALDFIGGALAVSLVVHASSSPAEADAMARSIMVRVVLLSTVGGLLLVALAPIGLRLLNPQYGEMGATAVIAVLAAGTVLRCVYMVWAGLQRARRNMKAPLVLNVASALVLLVFLPTLCSRHGALGGALALLLAQLALAVGIAVHFQLSRRQRMRSQMYLGVGEAR